MFAKEDSTPSPTGSKSRRAINWSLIPEMIIAVIAVLLGLALIGIIAVVVTSHNIQKHDEKEIKELFNNSANYVAHTVLADKEFENELNRALNLPYDTEFGGDISERVKAPAHMSVEAWSTGYGWCVQVENNRHETPTYEATYMIHGDNESGHDWEPTVNVLQVPITENGEKYGCPENVLEARGGYGAKKFHR